MGHRWPNLLARFIIAASSTAAVSSVWAGAEIDGQVFIVTGGHESVKLGLVAIAAFRPDEFTESVAHVRSQIDEERPRLERIRPIANKLTELYHQAQ